MSNDFPRNGLADVVELRCIGFRAENADTSAHESDDHFAQRQLRNLREGDPIALARLYDQHHQLLRSLALRLVGEQDIADDLVQEVFLVLPTAARGFRGNASLKTFICSILVNKARKHIRSAVRRRRAMERLSSQPPPPSLPEAGYQRRQLSERVKRALDTLSHKQRVVFILCEVEDWYSHEVALALNIKPATVRTRLFHAKRKLRERLECETDEGESNG